MIGHFAGFGAFGAAPSGATVGAITHPNGVRRLVYLLNQSTSLFKLGGLRSRRASDYARHLQALINDGDRLTRQRLGNVAKERYAEAIQYANTNALSALVSWINTGNP